MANSNKPFGFRWVGSISGPMEGKITKCYTASATAMFKGELVKLSGSIGRVNPDEQGYPVVEPCSTTTHIPLGVIVGFQYLPGSLAPPFYHKASVAQYLYVCTDPGAIYEVQGDATVWAEEDVGENTLITYTTGSSATGESKWVLTSPATTNTHDVNILGVSPDPKNELGAYMKFLVRLNYHQYRASAVTGV